MVFCLQVLMGKPTAKKRADRIVTKQTRYFKVELILGLDIMLRRIDGIIGMAYFVIEITYFLAKNRFYHYHQHENDEPHQRPRGED